MAATNLFEQQKKNLRRTAEILVGFVAFLVFLGIGADLFLYGSGAGPGFPIATLGALLFGAGSSLWALKGGDHAVLESANAVPLDRADPRQHVLDNVVEEMAFAAGSGPEKSSIAVTAGLLDALNREELQAVVSHEMSHVKNYDIRLMTVVAALVGSVLLISDWGRRGIGWGGRRRSSRVGGGGFLFLVFLVLWIVSLVLAPLIA